MSERNNTPEVGYSVVPVESFRSASLNNDPLLYPGERPARSYVTNGTSVANLDVTYKGGVMQCTVGENGTGQDLDEYLESHAAPLLADRIPVLSYGANMCPASLKSKFAKAEQPDMFVVPTLYSELEGYDVGWSRGPGINGNFIAILYKGEETKDTKVQVGVSMLTPSQVLVMHATELNYDLHELSVDVGGVELPAYYYAGKDDVYVENDRPFAIESVPATGRTLTEATTTTMLEKVLQIPEITELLLDGIVERPNQLKPQDYIDYVANLQKAANQASPKLAFKKQVHVILQSQGLAKSVEADDGDLTLASWANPSVLRTMGDIAAGRQHSEIYVLPSSELPIDRWPVDGRKRVLNGLKTHFQRRFDERSGVTA